MSGPGLPGGTVRVIQAKAKPDADPHGNRAQRRRWAREHRAAQMPHTRPGPGHTPGQRVSGRPRPGWAARRAQHGPTPPEPGDRDPVTDATPDPATRWTVTATYATGDRDRAHKALRALAGVVATDADSDPWCITARAEIETSTDTPGSYGQTFAAEIAAELRAIDRQQAQEIEDEIARMDAADGLDDQDGPVTRGDLFAQPHDGGGPPTVWAQTGDRWWAVDRTGHWLPAPGTPAGPLVPLDPMPAAPDTAEGAESRG